VTLVEMPAEVAALTEVEAREITNDIRRTTGVLWSQVAKAYQGRAWAALGYDSWDAYCDTEFDGARLKLPREERTMVVASLADAGMSNKAIAAAVGVTAMTVGRDMAGVTNVTPDDDDEIVDAEVIDDPPTPREVTGTDGKTYTLKPKPPVDRRPSLTDALDRSGWAIRKDIDRLISLTDDDRFSSHKEKVAPALGSHLQYAISVCQDVLDRLGITEEQR
jgi:hypothetical protein